MENALNDWIKNKHEFPDKELRLDNLLIDALFLNGTPDLDSEPVGKEFTHTNERGITERHTEPLRVPMRFGTSYGVKASNSYWQIEGNPSQLGLPENWFGMTYPQALTEMMEHVGAHGIVPSGKTNVHRIDITLNVQWGNQQTAKRWMQLIRLLELPHCVKQIENRYPKISFDNKAKRLTVYDKAVWFEEKVLEPNRYELHKLEKYRPYDKEQRASLERQIEHAEQCYQHAKETGAMRIELRLKPQGLKSRGLHNAADITQEKLEKVFQKETAMLKKTMLENGEEISFHGLGMLTAWMKGELEKDSMHRNTWNKYRKEIRETTGYDINAPGPVSLDRRRRKEKPKYMTEMERPRWYDKNREELLEME